MTTQQIANRLVELCKQGQYEKAQKELYADNAISIEPERSPGFEKETKGLSAIIEKGHKFEQMVDKSHAIDISNPLITGNAIAFTFSMDVTMKDKQRTKMEELCVYQVKDGKIVLEQ